MKLILFEYPDLSIKKKETHIFVIFLCHETKQFLRRAITQNITFNKNVTENISIVSKTYFANYTPDTFWDIDL